MGTDAGPRRMLASALDGVTTLRLRSRRGGAAVAAPFAYELAGEDARLYALVSDGAELRAALKRDPRVIVEAGGGGVPAVSGAARAVPVRDARAAADWRAAIAGRAAVATPDGAATVLRIVPEGLAVGPGEAGATTFFLRGPAGLAPLYGGRRRRARGLLARFVYYTRADVVPVMAMPVAIGTALAWREGARGRPGRLAVALAGAVAAHLAANVTNDYFDYRSGADERAAAEIGSLETGSGMLTGGVLAERQVVALAGGLWAVALGCGLVLAALAGPAIPALAGLGFLLAYGYVAPPLAFGYRGRGLGEAAILLAFGVLPALGGYYAQTGRLSSRVALASLPTGLYTTDVLFNHHFQHWRADRAVGKMTPVAALGEERAARVSLALVGLAYGTILLAIRRGALPPTAALATVTAPPVVRQLLAVRAGRDREFYGALMGRTVRASARTSGLILLGIVGDGLAARLRRATRHDEE